MRILMALLFLLGAVVGESATLNIDCTYPAITNALLTTAQDGDTVIIAAGDCTISNSILINRGISMTIAGSGTNSTFLRSPSGGLSSVLWYVNNSNSLVTVSNFTYCGTNGDVYAFLFGHPSYDSRGFYRISNVRFPSVGGRALTLGYGLSRNSYGLTDNCYFLSGPGYAQMFNPEGAGPASWTNSNSIGTSNVWTIEDCYMEATTGGNGFFDSYNGAQVVFRRNYCVGDSAIGGHGYDSGSSSIRTWEVYQNIFTNLGVSTVWSVWRGGTGVMFSNEVYGTSVATWIGMAYYRHCPQNNPYPTDTGYLQLGVPGRGYTINFSDWTNYPAGEGQTLTGQPANGQRIALGFTSYYFITNLTNSTFAMANVGGYGGGAVLIGSTVAETITNFYQAVNIGPGNWVTRSNAFELAFNVGHEFIAVGLNTTNLYLTNRLDGNTDEYGYPAAMQEGVVQSYALTDTNFVNTPVTWPMYFWSNNFNGVLREYENPSSSGCSINLTNLVKIGRDVFNQMPSAEVYTPLGTHPLRADPLPTGRRKPRVGKKDTVIIPGSPWFPMWASEDLSDFTFNLASR